MQIQYLNRNLELTKIKRLNFRIDQNVTNLKDKFNEMKAKLDTKCPGESLLNDLN